jgi:hypothetical protein
MLRAPCGFHRADCSLTRRVRGAISARCAPDPPKPHSPQPSQSSSTPCSWHPLRREARKRELSVPSLARALLTVIAEDGLAHAILDD